MEKSCFFFIFETWFQWLKNSRITFFPSVFKISFHCFITGIVSDNKYSIILFFCELIIFISGCFKIVLFVSEFTALDCNVNPFLFFFLVQFCLGSICKMCYSFKYFYVLSSVFFLFLVLQLHIY